jgi:hypothetical protein
MSGNTFTLTINEGASIDVTVVQVSDPTFLDLKRLYIGSIRAKSSLSSNRIYRVLITQPISPPTGYSTTGAASSLLFSSNASFILSGADPFDGSYTFTSNSASLIGTQQGQPQNVEIPCKFTLQSSTDGGTSWISVPFTGTGTNYIFDIGDNTNRQYDTKGVDRSSPVVFGGTATLYYKFDYNTTWSSAQLADGSTQVVIAGSPYTAHRETSQNALVTAGNDFSLYLPNSVNTDGTAGAMLTQDQQIVIVPFLEYNLMDLGLLTNGLQSVEGTGAPVNKNTERGSNLDFYAVIPWSQITIDSIEETPGNRISVNDILTPVYYGAFSYQGTTYTLSIVNGLLGKKNVHLDVQTSYGSAVTTTIHRIWIRPGVAGGGTKAL